MKNIKLLFSSICIALSFSSSAQTIALGETSSYSICNNAIKSWGYNGYGQLGIGSYTLSKTPVSVATLTDITAVSAGLTHVLTLKKDGTIWAWGQNKYGEIGNGSDFAYSAPTKTLVITGVTAISGGDNHSLALKNDGIVWAWGYNLRGALGNGTNTDSKLPVQVSSLTGVVAIAGGGRHSLALKNDGTVWCWGNNGNGQLGDGTVTNSNVPVQASGLTGIIAIAAGQHFCIALKSDGTVWTWGRNDYGQLGNGGTVGREIPAAVAGITNIVAIAGGSAHTLVLKNDGTVWAWGNNYDGEIGNGSSESLIVTPVQVSSLSGVTSIEGGGSHSLAMKSDGSVWTWGWNLYGQLGNGTQTSSMTPVEVTGLCSAVTALPENTLSMGISVYPNPSKGKFKINCSEGSLNTIVIFDVDGRKIYTSPGLNDRGEIDLSSAAKGVYFLKANTNQTTKSTRFIIR